MIEYPYRGARQDYEALADSYESAFLVLLFRSMLRIRRVEEAIENRYAAEQMKTPIHLVIGQEATSVGCCAAMTRDDLLYSSHRTHGNYLAKGGDLNAMIAELHGRANGCTGSRGGSMHLIDKRVGMAGTSAIVAGAVPIAVGAALAAKLSGTGRAVVVFLGDAATEEGVTSESLNIAALKRLPVVFCCENNFYSVQSPLLHRQPPEREIHRWAEAHGMPGLLVDGTNVLAVFEAVRTALSLARAGGGPTFIETPVYRFRAHGGVGDDSRSGYRDLREVGAWEAWCPVVRLRTYLCDRGLVGISDIDAMEQEMAAEIAEAFQYALLSPHPDPSDLTRHVYAH